MQVTTSINNSLSSAVPVVGAVASMLSKESELPPDALVAPVEEVTYSQAEQAPKQQDTYAKPVPVASQEQAQTQTAAAESQQRADAEQPQQLKAEQQQRQAEQQELEQLKELKARDQEVRTHEQAHMAVGGQYAGSASYTYQAGPDGVRYAVGGEVPIDVSQVQNDPAATLEKMQQVQRAAMAPAEPSSQDRQVAAQAGQVAAEAMNELAQQQLELRQQAADQLKVDQQQVQAEMQEARKQQEKAQQKEKEDESVSAAERFAEHNARMRQINDVLLQISMPKPKQAGQILNDIV